MFAAARCLMVLALMVSIGLHTVVVQSTAWASMLITYSMQNGSLSQAVAETFDGEHPCALCQLAKKTESNPADQKQAPQTDGKIKVQLIADAVPAIVISAPPSRVFPVRTQVRAAVLSHSPDTPPPRRTLA